MPASARSLPRPLGPIRHVVLDAGVFHARVEEVVFDGGLMARHGLDPAVVTRLAARLWKRHGLRDSTAEAYWRDWDDALGFDLDRDALDGALRDRAWFDPSVEALVRSCLREGLDVSLVSDSVSFWHAVAMRRTGLESYGLPCYLSYRLGVAKSAPNGAIARIAAVVKPSAILFAGCDAPGLLAAESEGMFILAHRRDSRRAVAEAVGSAIGMPTVH